MDLKGNLGSSLCDCVTGCLMTRLNAELSQCEKSMCDWLSDDSLEVSERLSEDSKEVLERMSSSLELTSAIEAPE